MAGGEGREIEPIAGRLGALSGHRGAKAWRALGSGRYARLMLRLRLFRLLAIRVIRAVSALKELTGDRKY